MFLEMFSLKELNLKSENLQIGLQKAKSCMKSEEKAPLDK